MDNKRPFDLIKPKDKAGFSICDACWKQVEFCETGNWVNYVFIHLKPVCICTDCDNKYHHNFQNLINKGV